MKHIAVNFQELPAQSSQLEKNSNKISLGQVIAGPGKSYLDIDALFIAHFNTIPNFVGEADIDCVKAYKWFSETYKPDIKDWHYGMRNFCQDNTTIFDDVYQILYEDEVIVNFDMNYSRARILFGKKTS